MRASTLASAILCCVAAAQALAQQQPSGGDDKRNNAAKIAGLVGFVNVSCPELRTDNDRFKAVIGHLGVSTPDLDQGELMLKARSYLEAYRKDIPGGCKRAAELFGPEGKVAPGLVLPK